MPHPSTPLMRQVIELAQTQDGLVTRSQLEALGFPTSTAAYRSMPGGPWQRVLPGVLAVHNGPLTVRQRLHAALLYAGAESMLTGAAALPLLGFRRTFPVPPIDVLVPDNRQRSSSGFVRLERTVRLPTPRERDGLAVAPAARVVFDAARRHGRADDVRALVAESVQRGFVRPSDLAFELSEGQLRGSRLLREAVVEVSAGVRSLAEADDRRLTQRRKRLRGMWWNPTILRRDGSFLFKPDGWLDEIALGWQIDSLEFHLSPEDYAATLRAHTRATACGILVVHHLPSELGRRPEEVLDELEAGVEAASLRPRPDVIAVRSTVSAA
jgi:hypothetical protein